VNVRPEFIVERQGRSFVLYAGLLSLAHDQGLKAIRTRLLQVPSDDNGQVAIVSAEVETERGTFSGIGDASPANVSRQMVTCLIRMAETRAKARALRDAVNVGVAALEELGDADDQGEHRPPGVPPTPPAPIVAPLAPAIAAAPASAEQRRAVARLAKAAGVAVNVDTLSQARASQMIRQLQGGKAS